MTFYACAYLIICAFITTDAVFTWNVWRRGADWDWQNRDLEFSTL